MTTAPASTAAAETTRVEVCLCRSGKIEHHDFVFELPKGMDPKEFLKELEESGLDSLWDSYRNFQHELGDRDCVYGPNGVEVKIVDHAQSETHYDMDETSIRWDCLENDNPHIEAFKS